MLSADENPLYGASVGFIRDLLKIPESTARRWKKQPETVPQSAAMLIQFALYGDLEPLAGKEWHGFSINNGKLFVPFFHGGFAPNEICAMFFQIQELNHTRTENEYLKNEIEILKSNAEKYRLLITGNNLDNKQLFFKFSE